MSVEVVIAAIECLGTSNNAEERSQANDFIIGFPNHPLCLETSIQLLMHNNSQVQVYACQFIYQKVKRNRAEITVDTRDQLKNTLFNRLLQLTQNPAQSAPQFITQKIASIYTTIGIRSKGGGKQMLYDVLTIASKDEQQISSRAILDILAVIPGAFDEYSYSYTESKEISLVTPNVLELLKYYLSQTNKPEFRWRIKAVLECATAWAEFERCSLVQMFSSGLLELILRLLLDPLYVKVAADAVESVLRSGNRPASDKHVKAVAAVAEALGQLQSVFSSATQNQVDDVAFHIGIVASTLCIHEIEFISNASESALKVIQLEVDCVSHPSKAICENALEFFECLQEQYFCQEHPSFAAQIYRSITEVLITKQIPYPDDFKSWEESVEDEDEFEKFRKMVIAALEPAFTVLKYGYLDLLGNVLVRNKHKWQLVESVFFGFYVSHEKLMERFDSKEVQETMQHFIPIFKDLFAGGFPEHPSVVVAGAKLVGGFAKWIKKDRELLKNAITFLVSHCKTPGAGLCVATAFKDICQTSSSIIAADPNSVVSIVEFCHQKMFANPTETAVTGCDGGANARNEFYKGLATLVDAIADANICKEALLRLLAPAFLGLESIRNSDEPSRLIARDNLSVISDVVNCLKHHSDPALALVERTWKISQHCSQLWPRDAEITERVCWIYTVFFGICGKDLREAFVSAIEYSTVLFTQTFSAKCLETLNRAVGILGSSPSTSDLFTKMLHQILEALTKAASQSTAGSENSGKRKRDEDSIWKHPDVIAEFLGLCRTMLQCCPRVLLNGTLLQTCLELTTAVLTNVQEFHALRAAFVIWNHLLKTKDHELQVPYVACARHFAPVTINILILGIADERSRRVGYAYGQTLYNLIRHFPDLTRECVFKTLNSPDFPSKALTNEDKQKFLDLMWGLRRKEARFRGLIQDFNLLCTGYSRSDCLVGYEMDLRPSKSSKEVVLVE